jgi:hypothetical protein
MAPKKSATSSRTPATRDTADGEAQATTRPKVVRRRTPAALPAVQAAPAEAPAATRAKPRVRKVSAAVAPDAASAPVPVPAAPARQVTDEHIRVRAYFLALESQGRGGSLDYWLRAERELRASAPSTD